MVVVLTTLPLHSGMITKGAAANTPSLAVALTEGHRPSDPITSDALAILSSLDVVLMVLLRQRAPESKVGKKLLLLKLCICMLVFFRTN